MDFVKTLQLFSFILLLNAQLSTGSNEAYCDPVVYGRFAEFGTLCRYSPTSFGPACIIVTSDVTGGITDTIKEYIVDKHNDLRDFVASGNETRGFPSGQPAATNMNILTWSEELADAAQAWANQCQRKSDINRNESTSVVTSASSNPVYVGQNIYAYIELVSDHIFNETEYWNQAINRWYSEVRIFNPAGIPNFRYNAPTGHYTQIVSSRTTLIGCGFTQWFMTLGRMCRLLICNYGPGGNINGEPIYGVVGPGGKPCSNCERNGTCTNNLCS